MTTNKSGKRGLLSASGALLAAALSSACCWLPLALISVGASAAGVGSFFEAYRLHFLILAASLLAVGFYYVYFRRRSCEAGDACSRPDNKIERWNKGGLWFATLFIVLFGAFPSYFELFISDW